MLTDNVAALDEVAAALGIDGASLKRRHRTMHRKSGFPMPLPGGNWRWSRAAVALWMETAGATPAPEAAAADPDARDGALLVLEQHRVLRARYGERHA